MSFKKYKRKEIAELREVTDEDIVSFIQQDGLLIGDYGIIVSISQEDCANGSPKIGDMIARNPKNHKDMWLIEEQYFNDNFELNK